MALDRRHFLVTGGAFGGSALAGFSFGQRPTEPHRRRELAADVVIVGGGLGGCAAALSALRNGSTVVMTETTDWIGGQLTSQAVPPDEHRWIETHGANASYRELRDRIRQYYRRHYPLTQAARKQEHLNPGNGTVSRLCHEPRVALAVLRSQLAPYLSGRRLVLLTETEPIDAEVDGDRVRAVTVRHRLTGEQRVLTAPLFVDATELGDLLPLTGTEYITGAESKAETGELHAADQANPENQQAFTICFAIDHVEGEDHTIDKPHEYAFWRQFAPELTPPWPGRLLDFTYTHPRSGQPKTLGFDPTGERHGGVINLWTYRRLADQKNFAPGTYPGDVILVNWPQNDYLLGNLVDVSREQYEHHVQRAEQLSLSLLYWLQTEAPRFDGGQGFPALRLRGDLLGTTDGLAKAPYVRESRRIRSMFTVLEQHVGAEQRAMVTGASGGDLRAAAFHDSVGVGSYAIDLHPSTAGDNYIDFPTLPFQIPLGALLPQRMENLLPACKNIGTTHLTGGCYRLHPVEWGIGEAVGCLASFVQEQGVTPRAVREQPELLSRFQNLLQKQGVEIAWP